MLLWDANSVHSEQLVMFLHVMDQNIKNTTIDIEFLHSRETIRTSTMSFAQSVFYMRILLNN